MKQPLSPAHKDMESQTAASSDPTKVWIHGAKGRMGLGIRTIIEDDPNGNFSFAGGSGRTLVQVPGLDNTSVDQQSLAEGLRRVSWDVILDFSVPAANLTLLNTLQSYKDLQGGLVLGTTGLEPSVMDQWLKLPDSQPGLRLLIAPNTSLGILGFRKTLAQMASILVSQGYDIELVEAHHKFKLDAPSGTAKMLAKAVTDVQTELQPVYNRQGQRQTGQLGMHAVRGGGVAGEHEVRFIGPDDQITLGHRAFSRALFAKGALALGRWIKRQPPGLYQVEEINLAELTVI